MFHKLANLKRKGYTPDIIFDIGAHHGNWTLSMMPIYSTCQYYLFEAIDYVELNRLSVCPNVKHFNVVLNDTAKMVDWYQMKNTGDSMFREKTHHFDNCTILQRNSIDLNTFVKDQSIASDPSQRIFMKIDCQGAELPILKGASTLMDRTDFILLELPFFGQYNEGVPNFLEHIQVMDSIGFVPYDIVDTHYVNGFTMQLDVLFINKQHEFNKAVNTHLTSTVYS